MVYQPENDPHGNENNVISEDEPLSEFGRAKITPRRKSSKAVDTTITRKIAVYAFITFFIMLATSITLIAVTMSGKQSKPMEHSLFYTRQEWGAIPAPNFTERLYHPTHYVIISDTGTNFCKNLTECSQTVLDIQSTHMEHLEASDIGYNFLVGGDGHVYIGRDWDVINFHGNNTIGISFIGNFTSDNLTGSMISALKELLNLGTTLHKLSPRYKLVGQNQTEETSSPGANVIKEIVKFPNYYPGSIEIALD